MESGEGFTMRKFIFCTVGVIKSRRLRWAGHVARMEECRSTLKILVDKPAGIDVDGRTILKWSLKR